jgi:hypothetical protein
MPASGGAAEMTKKITSSSGSISASLLEVTPDLQTALQTHRKRRWFSPGDSATALDIGDYTVAIGLKADETSGRDYHYHHLLQVAIATGDVTRVAQLLESGNVDPDRPIVISSASEAAAAGGADSYPDLLHWCAAQTPIPWPSIFVLLEHGCRCPKKLQLPFATMSDGTFSRIQQQLISDAFAYLSMHYTGTSNVQGVLFNFKPMSPVGLMSNNSTDSSAAIGLGAVGAVMGPSAQPLLLSRQLSESLELDCGGSQLHVPGSCAGGPGVLLPMHQDTFSTSGNSGSSNSSAQATLQQRAVASTGTGNIFRRLHQSAVTSRTAAAASAVKQHNVPITSVVAHQSTATTLSSSPVAAAATATTSMANSQAFATGKPSQSSPLTCSTSSSTGTGSGIASSAAAPVAATANQVSSSTTSTAAAHINKFKEQLNFSFDADSTSPRVEITSIKASSFIVLVPVPEIKL